MPNEISSQCTAMSDGRNAYVSSSVSWVRVVPKYPRRNDRASAVRNRQWNGRRKLVESRA